MSHLRVPPAAPELFDKHLPVLTAATAVSAWCPGLEERYSWGNTIHTGLSIPMWFAQGLAAPAKVVLCIGAVPGDGRSCVICESVPEEGLVSPKPFQLGMYCQPQINQLQTRLSVLRSEGWWWWKCPVNESWKVLQTHLHVIVTQ